MLFEETPYQAHPDGEPLVAKLDKLGIIPGIKVDKGPRPPGGERITEMELGVRLKVIGTPSFYFLEPDGEPISRSPGHQSADDLLLLHAICVVIISDIKPLPTSRRVSLDPSIPLLRLPSAAGRCPGSAVDIR